VTLVSRFAPSPTGPLHLGHAYSAAIGQARARESGGRFLLRIEDLDPARRQPRFVVDIDRDLEWLGLHWDAPPIVQSQRTDAYTAALARLRGQALIYPCFCTRADIAAALEAPHGPSASHYPGTCRYLPDDPPRRAENPHAWRIDVAKAVALVGLPSWRDDNGLLNPTSVADFDDVILARKDAPAAYHLACVVDDAASGVTLVVRGADLRSSTPIQRLLQTLLGLPEPAYLHHPLVTHRDGRRLAKRDQAPTLAAMRDRGIDGRTLAAELVQGKLPLGFVFSDA
jgi:glutamyl-Q tRNA(Asp) synthetase